MTFAAKLRELRASKGLSQSDLAKKIGVSQKAMSDWESGAYTPSVELLTKICSELGVKLRAFEGCDFTPTDEKRSPGRPKKGK